MPPAFLARLALIAALPTSLAASAQGQTPPPPPPPPATMAPSLAATIAAMPKNLPRASGPSLDRALAAATAAQRACAARQVPVSVLIADSVGAPVVLLSGDGAGVRSALITRSKARIVARYGVPSAELETRARTDAALAAEGAADPEIGVFRSGGYPVLRDGRRVAIVAVSGGSLTGVKGMDEACAQVAVDLLSRP